MEAFDARRALLDVAADTPRRAWPTAALLYGLRRDLLTAPWFTQDRSTRQHALKEAVAVLSERGIDADALIRYGFGDLLRRAIVAGVAAFAGARYEVLANGGEVPEDIDLPAVWAAMIGPAQDRVSASPFGSQDTSPARPGARINDQFCIDDDAPFELSVTDLSEIEIPRAALERVPFLLRRLTGAAADAYFTSWLASAPLDHLLAWDGVASYPVRATAPEDVVDQYRWLVDRLTVTTSVGGERPRCIWSGSGRTGKRIRPAGLRTWTPASSRRIS